MRKKKPVGLAPDRAAGETHGMTRQRRAAFAAMAGLGLLALGGCVIRDDDDDGDFQRGYRRGRQDQRRANRRWWPWGRRRY